MRPEIANKKLSPAPGHYNAHDLIGNEGLKSSFSPQLKEIYIDRRNKEIPGPGQYDSMYDQTKGKGPSFKIGTETRDEKGPKNKNPDGGAYNPNATFTKQAAPSYKMGTGERQDCYDKKKARNEPGPGNYDLNPAAFSNKAKFHYGSKLKDQSRLQVPGAGTYDPNGSTSKKAPSYGMGLKLKGDMASKEGVPGPGQYANTAEKTKQAAPTWGFGSSQRKGFSKTDTPGPGQYYIPVHVADVPDFQMPCKMPEFKNV